MADKPKLSKQEEIEKTKTAFVNLWMNTGPYLFAGFLSQFAGSDTPHDLFQGVPLSLKGTIMLFFFTFIVHMTVITGVIMTKRSNAKDQAVLEQRAARYSK